MTSASPVILDVSQDGVAVVLLNRPEKKNAFDDALIKALSDTFETLKGADHVRIVFIRGAGEMFCAGADIEWMRAQGKAVRSDNEAGARAVAYMLKALHDLPQTTVALVKGGAYGGGAGLVAACDIAVAVKGSGFRFSEVRLGLIPATISPFIIEAIGPRWAKALFVSAESFDAAFAEKIGLIQYAVDTDEELESMAEHLSALAFAAAPGAVAETKRLVRLVLDSAARPRTLDIAPHVMDEQLLHDLADRLADRRASEEAQQGLAAFLEKRKAPWDM